MAFQENSAVADIGQIYALLKVFLLGIGWTLDGEVSSSSAPVLSMHKDSAFFTISGGITVTAALAYGSGVFNHVDGNNWGGSFTTVWFFADPDKNYFHVVATKGVGDYYHFSFGQVDSVGMTGNSYYATAQQWDMSSPINLTARPSNVPAFVSQAAFVIPNGVLNPSFAGSGDLATNVSKKTLDVHRFAGDSTVFPYDGEEFPTFKILDYVADMQNTNTTGGVHLHSIPLIAVLNTYDHNLGIAPDVRLCSITNLSDAQEVINSGDTWKVFPVMKRGFRSSLYAGISPVASLNSVNLGFAYKKT